MKTREKDALVEIWYSQVLGLIPIRHTGPGEQIGLVFTNGAADTITRQSHCRTPMAGLNGCQLADSIQLHRMEEHRSTDYFPILAVSKAYSLFLVQQNNSIAQMLLVAIQTYTTTNSHNLSILLSMPSFLPPFHILLVQNIFLPQSFSLWNSVAFLPLSAS